MKPNAIRKARAKLGLSRAELGQSLGVSARAVTSWEQGWRPVSGPAIKLIERMLKDKT